MHIRFIGAGVAALACAAWVSATAAGPGGPGAVTIEQVTSYAFPSELVASPSGQRVAWTTVQRGVRCIWVAEGPAFQARELVTYPDDDGQELTGFAFGDEGKYLVYVRGGDHSANWSADRNLAPNPSSMPTQAKVQVWAVLADGSGKPVLLGDGDHPAPQPHGERVAFDHDSEIWSAPIDGSKPAARLFFARGGNRSPLWSPDGKAVAFVSYREAHSLIGVYSADDQPIRYLAPSTGSDYQPQWSPDSTQVAFVRTISSGGPPVINYATRLRPWAIWVADAKTGEGQMVWRSTSTLRGSVPWYLNLDLMWAAGDRLLFRSYEDGWPHLYSVSARTAAPNRPNQALLLTPGAFMVEDVTLTPDRRQVIYSANTGVAADDSERRHLFRVPIDAATPQPITTGAGLEWSPVVVAADGGRIAYFASGATVPPGAFVRALNAEAAQAMGGGQPAADFPSAQLVTPRDVTFKAADGVTVHGELFGADAKERKPAIVFVHGGPPRQMLLGWHSMNYYANAYAMNEYFATRGFIVLSVNYRLGIGYGFDFQRPANAGDLGASEYQDVLAAGRYLQQRPDVDPARIGIWGGSYGGFLTALALGRNSDVFAAGVDLHGVHSFLAERASALTDAAVESAAAVGDGVTPAELDQARRVAWESSPIAHVKTWRSPVLLIHGDDDRNVRIAQTVDLVRRLEAKGVDHEEMLIPDEIHGFLTYRVWIRVNHAVADYLERKLKPGPATASR